MSATNSTANINLPLFIGTDKPSWLVDWNGAMNAIDAAIASLQAAESGTSTALASLAQSLEALSGTVGQHTTALQTLTTAVSGNTGSINTINSLIGNGQPTTTDKTIIGAINEINAKIPEGGEVAADDVTYDNQTSGLQATNVQGAIDEVYAAIPSSENVEADDVSYDNTTSGLTATNVQEAIDEVVSSSKEWTLVNDPTTALPADYTECYVFVTGTGAPASFITFVKDAVSGLSDIGIVNGGYMSANYSWSLTVHVMNSGEKIGTISLYNNGSQVSNPAMKVYVR